VRDLLADCLSTLPALIERPASPALHFYFATFDALHRQLYPEALAAYEELCRSGNARPLRRVVDEGKARWLETAQDLLALAPAAREAAIGALLGVAVEPQRGTASTV
jgi:hypothetical protein